MNILKRLFSNKAVEYKRPYLNTEMFFSFVKKNTIYIEFKNDCKINKGDVIAVIINIDPTTLKDGLVYGTVSDDPLDKWLQEN